VFYDAATRDFTWLVRPREHFRGDRHWKGWNVRFAGKRAGTISVHGYHVIVIGQIQYRANRLAWLLVHGEPVPDLTDHIDTDKLNNRIANLRAATHADNGANSKVRSNNRLGVKGVRVRQGGYEARISRHGEDYHLGCFKTIEEAVKAYRDAAERLQGVFACHE
jgi:hypothetical protein